MSSNLTISSSFCSSSFDLQDVSRLGFLLRERQRLRERGRKEKKRTLPVQGFQVGHSWNLCKNPKGVSGSARKTQVPLRVCAPRDAIRILVDHGYISQLGKKGWGFGTVCWFGLGVARWGRNGWMGWHEADGIGIQEGLLSFLVIALWL